MTTQSQVPVILVVDTTEDVGNTAATLRAAGYEAVEADSFDRAKSLLSTMRPDLLITDIQLGAYNGLHLVWRRHLDLPGSPTIVTNSYADSVLETEAHTLGCPYLLKPIASQILLGTVRTLLGPEQRIAVERRHWRRTSAREGVEFMIDDTPAAVVDLSYGGCRLRLPHGAAVPLAHPLSVPIPASEFVAEGIPVWKAPARGGDIYGIAIQVGEAAALDWIRFVDDVTSEGAAEV